MSLGMVLGLVVIGAVLYRFAWRRLAVGMWWLAGGGLVAAACGWLPSLLLARLQAPYAQRPVPSWGAHEVIVLLGAGTVRLPGAGIEPTLFAHGRIDEAARLYRDCKTHGGECQVEVSGGDALHIGRAEAQVYGDALVALGVARSDLLLESRSMNTWQNAQFSAPLLRAQEVPHVWLVSSAFHLRRAGLYFAHFGVRATPVRGDWLTARVGWQPLAWNLALTDLALHEYLGVWRYGWYQRMGWNGAATQPGAP